jgi:hypothetical protein
MSGDRKAAAGINENWRASRREVFVFVAGVLTGCRSHQAGQRKQNVPGLWCQMSATVLPTGQERNMHIYDVFQQHEPSSMISVPPIP